MLQRHALKGGFVALATLVLACKAVVGGESHEDPANGSGDTRNWAFTWSISKTTGFDVKQATSDTILVTINRTGGFTGSVNLELFQPGPGFTVTSENVTATGVVTTARVVIAIPGNLGPISGLAFGLSARPVSEEVLGKDTVIKFNVIRKDGTFINTTSAVSIGRGQGFTQRVSIIRTNYTAAVPFNLVGAPAGVTATFSPNPVTDTVTQMTLNVDASVPEGVYNLGVRANEGIGTFQGTAPLALTVTPPGTVAVSFTTNPLAVPAGPTPVPTTVNISRTNFPGVVNVAVSGVPPGLTVSLPPPVPGNSFTATFSATVAATAGSYPITFTFTGVGLTPVTAVLTVNISK